MVVDPWRLDRTLSQRIILKPAAKFVHSTNLWRPQPERTVAPPASVINLFIDSTDGWRLTHFIWHAAWLTCIMSGSVNVISARASRNMYHRAMSEWVSRGVSHHRFRIPVLDTAHVVILWYLRLTLWWAVACRHGVVVHAHVHTWRNGVVSLLLLYWILISGRFLRFCRQWLVVINRRRRRWMSPRRWY